MVRLEQAGRERPDAQPRGRPRVAGRRCAIVAVGERERRQSPDQPEPDREDLAVAAPWLAAELGHRDQGDHRVADEDDPETLAAPGRRDRQLEPDHDTEADDGRPAAHPVRVRCRSTARQPEPGHPAGGQAVERAEWVKPRPDRTDERRGQGKTDPAVRPQEERRDIALGVSAEDDRLDDDPGPGEEADDRDRPTNEPGNADRPVRRHGRGGEIGIRAFRRPVATREQDRERHADGECGADEVRSERDR